MTVVQPASTARIVAGRIGTGARGRRWAALGFVAPLILVILLGFDVPLLTAFGWSVRDSATSEPTLANYGEFLASPIYLRVIWRTAAIAATTTVVCALLGYPLALWMSRLALGRQLVALAFVVVPFWVSILVRTYAWIVVLGNGGIVNRWLQDLGLADKPVAFLYNEFGVVLGMVNVVLPFLVLPLYAAMLRLDPRLMQVAETLGASRLSAFWRVQFPLTLPALGAAMVLVLILSLGFYITPAILGGGKVPMISNMMDQLINRFPRWEMAAAISVVLLLLTSVFYGVYQWLRSPARA